MTAADLKAIGLRVERDDRDSCGVAIDDRARLYEAVERLVDFSISEANGRWCIGGMPGDLIWFENKDAAIDALLAQGGGE